jgi:hypothetical protein
MSLYTAVAADIQEDSAKWSALAYLLRAAEMEATRTLALAALGEQRFPGPPREAIDRLAVVVDPDFMKVRDEMCPAGSLVTASVPDEDFQNWVNVVQEAAFRLGMAIGARIGGAR